MKALGDETALVFGVRVEGWLATDGGVVRLRMAIVGSTRVGLSRDVGVLCVCRVVRVMLRGCWIANVVGASMNRMSVDGITVWIVGRIGSGHVLGRELLNTGGLNTGVTRQCWLRAGLLVNHTGKPSAAFGSSLVRGLREQRDQIVLRQAKARDQ